MRVSGDAHVGHDALRAILLQLVRFAASNRRPHRQSPDVGSAPKAASKSGHWNLSPGVRSDKTHREKKESGVHLKPDIVPVRSHFRHGPCVDGSGLARVFFTSQVWSVRPCVRPIGAVHMTAGHNALRGSGPDQKLAFDNAVAHVGCPDRRIDRLCITCCSPSQPSHHAGCPV